MAARALSPVDPRTGLIRWVFDLPIEAGEPRIFNAAVKMADTGRYVRHRSYDNNGGSGLTVSAARNSAIGEGLERYCASVYAPDALLFGPARELRDRYWVPPPDSYALFAPDQEVDYSPFDDDTRLAWTAGQRLGSNEPAVVPACLVYMPYHPEFRDRREQRVGPAISTGLACASSHEDAALRGLLEAVERDAFMTTWLGATVRQRLDFESHPVVGPLYRKRLARDGLEYVVVDITSDVDIPTALCILIDWHRSPPMISAGAATSLDGPTAATKAMLEAVQTREWGKFLGSMPELEALLAGQEVREFEEHVALYAYGGLVDEIAFLTDAPAADGDDFWRRTASGDAKTDLAVALGALHEVGLEAVAIDLTTVDVAQSGLSVVKVASPPLQPLYADETEPLLGGTRWREVPHKLGLESALDAEQLPNNAPHPFP